MLQIIDSTLILYSWIVAAILILFLFLIGRFYEIKVGQKSSYQLFLLPLVLFLIAALWYAFFARNTTLETVLRSTGTPLQDFVGLFWPDLLLLLGGVSLIMLCHSLHRIMLGGKG